MQVHPRFAGWRQATRISSLVRKDVAIATSFRTAGAEGEVAGEAKVHSGKNGQ